MEELSNSGFSFIVISNQAGIARGMIKQKELDKIHYEMTKELNRRGVNIIDIYISPDHWEQYSETRKPEAGMFYQAGEKYNLRLEHCLYIGDDIRDCMAAANAGCGMVYLTEEETVPRLDKKPKPFSKKKTIMESVSYIISQYSKWEEK